MATTNKYNYLEGKTPFDFFTPVNELTVLRDSRAIGYHTYDFTVSMASFVPDLIRYMQHYELSRLEMKNIFGELTGPKIKKVVDQYYPERHNFPMEKRVHKNFELHLFEFLHDTVFKGLDELKINLIYLMFTAFLDRALIKDDIYITANLHLEALDVKFNDFIYSLDTFYFKDKLNNDPTMQKHLKNISDKLPVINDEFTLKITKLVDDIPRIFNSIGSPIDDFRGILHDVKLYDKGQNDKTSFHECDADFRTVTDMINYHLWASDHASVNKNTSFRTLNCVALIKEYFRDTSNRFAYTFLTEYATWYECDEYGRRNNNSPRLMIFNRAMKRPPIGDSMHLRDITNYKTGPFEVIKFEPTSELVASELAAMQSYTMIDVRKTIEHTIISKVLGNRNLDNSSCQLITPFSLDSQEAMLLAASLSDRIKLSFSGTQLVTDFEIEFFEYNDAFLRSLKKESAIASKIRTKDVTSVLLASKLRPNPIGFPFSETTSLRDLTPKHRLVGSDNIATFLQEADLAFLGTLTSIDEIGTLTRIDVKATLKVSDVITRPYLKKVINVVLLADIKDIFSVSYAEKMYTHTIESIKHLSSELPSIIKSERSINIADYIRKMLTFPNFEKMVIEFLALHKVEMIFANDTQCTVNISIASLNIIKMLEKVFSRSSYNEIDLMISELSKPFDEIDSMILRDFKSAVNVNHWSIVNVIEKRGR